MKKNLLMFTLIAGTLFISSCRPQQHLVGNDRDQHGCIASAGYQWSELLKDCIRPFEKGIRLTDSQNPDAVSAAYLVFNADASQVELFLPKEKKRPILKKQGDIWANKSYTVKKNNGKWTLLRDGKQIFAE